MQASPLPCTARRTSGSSPCTVQLSPLLLIPQARLSRWVPTRDSTQPGSGSARAAPKAGRESAVLPSGAAPPLHRGPGAPWSWATAARASSGLLRRMLLVLAPCSSTCGGRTVRARRRWRPHAWPPGHHLPIGGTAAWRSQARRRWRAGPGSVRAQWAAACMRARPRKLLPASQEPVLHVHVCAGRWLLCKVLWMWGPACWPCAERASGQRSAPACPVCLHARNLSAMQMSVLLVCYDRRGSVERLQQTGWASHACCGCMFASQPDLTSVEHNQLGSLLL